MIKVYFRNYYGKVTPEVVKNGKKIGIIDSEALEKMLAKMVQNKMYESKKYNHAGNKFEKFTLHDRKAIRIPFTHEDLEDLRYGERFNWTFDGVDCELFLGEDDE